ncbi:unnamed protein product [Ectocarpus sp. 6 AP-2014]
MTSRRRESTGGRGVHMRPCAGFTNFPASRFGNTRRVWPPPQVQIAHPSLGVATLVNGARFRARAGLGDFIKSAGAGGGGGGSKGGNDDDEVTKLIDKYGDRIGEVGFGGVVGFCSGYAMMKVGKAIAFVIGVGFIVVQGLNYSGVVTIKWEKAEVKVKSLFDSNKDGKVDKEDAKALWKRLKTALTHNLPAGGGFTGGFALGLCCG